MKKIMTFAAVFAALMMSFSACTEKEDQKTTDNGDGTEQNGTQDGNEDGTEGGTTETTAAITIDGNYDDWDKLEGVQVATLPSGDVKYEQLKTLKAYADEEFIYIFCEFDPENTLVFVPYFDLDGDPATGNSSKWSGAGYEAKAEGSVFEELDGPAQGAAHAWDPSFYYYGDSTTEVLASGMAVTSSVPASYKNGNWAFETAILREVILDSYASVFTGTRTDSFTFGMYQYDLSWSCIGQLPCKSMDKLDNGETEPMLTITLP